MEFFVILFVGIPVFSIVFRVLIADATSDNENKTWKKVIGIICVILFGSGFAVNGLSNEAGLVSFALLVSFLYALWKNKND